MFVKHNMIKQKHKIQREIQNMMSGDVYDF